jgi:hypothetical protein
MQISRLSTEKKNSTPTRRSAVLGGKNVDLIVFFGHFVFDGMTLLSLSGILPFYNGGLKLILIVRNPTPKSTCTVCVYSSGRVIRTHGAEAQPQVLRWFFVGWAASLRFLSGGLLPKVKIHD